MSWIGPPKERQPPSAAAYRRAIAAFEREDREGEALRANLKAEQAKKASATHAAVELAPTPCTQPLGPDVPLPASLVRR
jgi:hypothetical protein